MFERISNTQSKEAKSLNLPYFQPGRFKKEKIKGIKTGIMIKGECNGVSLNIGFLGVVHDNLNINEKAHELAQNVIFQDKTAEKIIMLEYGPELLENSEGFWKKAEDISSISLLSKAMFNTGNYAHMLMGNLARTEGAKVVAIDFGDAARRRFLELYETTVDKVKKGDLENITQTKWNWGSIASFSAHIGAVATFSPLLAGAELTGLLAFELLLKKRRWVQIKSGAYSTILTRTNIYI